MTKKLSLIPLLTLALILTSCGTREGVVINGVRWATHNVDAPGTFAQNPESAGNLFTWEEAQNACPQGWRLPNEDELRLLRNADSEWTTKNDVNGRIFGTAPNQIFLPASGARDGFDGSLNYVGMIGFYWSSTDSDDSEDAMYLWFGNSNVSVLSSWLRDELSVRCVAESTNQQINK